VRRALEEVLGGLVRVGRRHVQMGVELVGRGTGQIRRGGQRDRGGGTTPKEIWRGEGESGGRHREEASGLGAGGQH
jgi:hypothetical protein